MKENEFIRKVIGEKILNRESIRNHAIRTAEMKLRLPQAKRSRRYLIYGLPIILLLLVSAIAVLVIGNQPTVIHPVATTSQEEMLGSVKRSQVFYSWEEITKKSEQIIIGRVGSANTSEKAVEGIFSFVFTDIFVESSLKGSLGVNSTIRLFQTKGIREDPIVKQGETVLLFLQPYVGPITENGNTFVCMGLFDGQYIIKDGRVIESYIFNGSSKSAENKIWGVDNSLKSIMSVIRENLTN